MYLNWVRIKAVWNLLTRKYYYTITSKDGKTVDFQHSVTFDSFVLMTEMVKPHFEKKEAEEKIMKQVAGALNYEPGISDELV